MLDVVWDMETGDPDDFVTLLLLLGHPRVNLKAVTITPGTPDQVGLVRRALEWFGRSIPVGAYDLDHQTPSAKRGSPPGPGRHGDRGACVSSWHYAAYGAIPPSRDAAPGAEVLREACDDATTLVTGGPLKNLGAAMKLPGFRLGRLVAQGGFAGEGVVPRERQLAKFRGLTTCPTYNLNGDPRSALAALEHPGIGVKRFVSKNVCHGVVYDRALHDAVGALVNQSLSLRLIWRGMQEYLGAAAPSPPARARNGAIGAPVVALVGPRGERLGPTEIGRALALAREQGLDLVEMHPGASPPVCRLMPPAGADESPARRPGKIFHDPLAACCAIDESIGEWAEVELYRERGEWGARLRPGSGVWIIIGYDRERFLRTLTDVAGDGARRAVHDEAPGAPERART
jgi:inosine-uridine nucleoside N-ribohydrolase